jgi:hypothetical protein
MQIIAMVATAIPHTDIKEITLIALCDFLENKYLLAIKSGKFKVNSLIVQQSVDIFYIIK